MGLCRRAPHHHSRTDRYQQLVIEWAAAVERDRDQAPQPPQRTVVVLGAVYGPVAVVPAPGTIRPVS